MLVTTTKLQTYILVLMAHNIKNGEDEKGQPKLAEVSWLAKDQWWTDSKSFTKLKKHYNLMDADFKFIDKNSLSIDDPTQALLIEALIQIDEYAQEKRQCFDLPLDLSLGTEFQQQVWQALQDIGYGETISYATLAQRVDNPKGYRAVANANGKNPFSIIVPCHRVIASDGKLGGYTGGLDKKEYLLALEGVELILPSNQHLDQQDVVMSETYLVSSAEISAMEGVSKTHFLNTNAQRINRSLGDIAGLTGFGFHIIEVQPDHETTEHHRHYHEDECVFVLAGTATAFIGNEAYEITVGDFIGYRKGGLPHSIKNTGAEVFRCIVVGERLAHDVGDYTRLKKRIYRNVGMTWNLVDYNHIEEIGGNAGKK